MLKNIKKIILVSVIVFMLAGSVTWAATTNSNGLITPSDPGTSSTMLERIAKRVDSSNTQPTEARKQRIIKQCSVVQAGLQEIKTKSITAASERSDVYNQLATRIETTIDLLERQSFDTAKLKAAQKKFNSAINLYLSNAVIYKTAMDDSIIMNCTSDPDGFEATLLSARQLRSELGKNVAAIKATVPKLTKVLDEAKQALIKSTNEDSN